MPAEILINPEPRYVFERNCLALDAVVDGRAVTCLVSGELLLTRFEARDISEAALREAYKSHAEAIREIIGQHIANGGIDDRNRVILTRRYTLLSVQVDGSVEEDPEIARAVEMCIGFSSD